MSKILFLTATHGNEGYSIPVLERIEEQYSKDIYDYDWLISNPRALQQDVRFTESDLNRSAPGNLESNYYEERRAAELVALSGDYSFLVDIHGADSACGVTTLIPYPTLGNLALAQAFDIQKNVIWYSANSSSADPIAQHSLCPAIELECGPKDSPEIAEQLFKVIEKLLQKDRRLLSELPDTTTSEFYEVYGKDLSTDREFTDFTEATLPDGERFFPYMSKNQYKGTSCYKMKRLEYTDVLSTKVLKV